MSSMLEWKEIAGFGAGAAGRYRVHSSARGMHSRRYNFIRIRLKCQRPHPFAFPRGGGACIRRQECGAGQAPDPELLRPDRFTACPDISIAL